MKILSCKPGEWEDGPFPGSRQRFHEIFGVAAVGDFDSLGLCTAPLRFNRTAWGGVKSGHLQFLTYQCDRQSEHWDIRITLLETTVGYDDPCQLLIDGELKEVASVTHRKLYGEPVEFRDFMPSA